jgi:uncharacterized protein (DUF433 family)
MPQGHQRAISSRDTSSKRVSRPSFRESRFAIRFRGATYLTGHRVAVWEVILVHEDTKSVDKTARHFGWPRVLVTRALAYAKAFPDEIGRARGGETNTASITG